MDKIKKVSDKMAMTKRLERQYTNELINIEEMIHEDHFLRVIEKHFDWNFIYEELADMLEVIKALAKLENKTLEDVIEVADQKVKKEELLIKKYI